MPKKMDTKGERRKKRSTPVRSPRKTSYDRALETAEKRLPRAKEELAKHTQKAEFLKQEIPYLQHVIALLSNHRQDRETERPYTLSKAVAAPVSADLAQYVAPSLDGVGSVPAVHDPEDDKFLPDV